MNMGMVHY